MNRASAVFSPEYKQRGGQYRVYAAAGNDTATGYAAIQTDRRTWRKKSAKSKEKRSDIQDSTFWCKLPIVPNDKPQLGNPKAVAEQGERLYQEKFRKDFEAKYLGKFVVIDVVTEKPYVGDTPESAYELAREDAPKGIFHLLKVGQPGAFRVSYSSHGDMDWLFR
jgi:hypothetical protein